MSRSLLTMQKATGTVAFLILGLATPIAIGTLIATHWSVNGLLLASFQTVTICALAFFALIKLILGVAATMENCTVYSNITGKTAVEVTLLAMLFIVYVGVIYLVESLGLPPLLYAILFPLVSILSLLFFVLERNDVLFGDHYFISSFSIWANADIASVKVVSLSPGRVSVELQSRTDNQLQLTMSTRNVESFLKDVREKAPNASVTNGI